MPSDSSYVGFQNLTSSTDERNAVDFMVRMILGQLATATVVQVQAVTPSGDPVGPVGTVDVLPLVNQINGAGDATPHGTLYALPYFRLQGGANAVIMDPRPGDLGLAVFASRDISSVKANKAQSNPGSRRQFDMADGLYLGGFLNGAPEQYVRFHANGIDLTTPGTVTVTADTAVNITAPEVAVDGATSVTVTSAAIELDGPVHITGAVTGDSTAVFIGNVTGAGIGLSTHKHTGVTTGAGTSGTPVP